MLHHLVTYEQIFQIHLEYLLLSHQIDLNYAETVIAYNIFLSNLSESDEYPIINNIAITIEIIDDVNSYIINCVENIDVELQSYLKKFNLQLENFVRTKSRNSDLKLLLDQYSQYETLIPTWCAMNFATITLLRDKIKSLINIFLIA